ncbi:hypothetical protein J2N86_09375 [Legionella lytica]|uniref:T2SS substrate NttA domain-containing protein n=1 Tax=Legionella lytica TaxID=96232 RepID=A0ABY4Y5L5_9GAMM|nr:hypothetical protein [Legionella lytica]USQ12915.1 hypothetical protein J2N86_09375 [Legionella lytica]
MQKQTLIAVSILLGSSIACADTTPSTTTTTAPAATSVAPAEAPAAPAVPAATETSPDVTSEMTKDAWLKAIEPMLPTLICKGFMNDPDLKQRLETIKMTYDQCVSVIPESVDKCHNQLYASIPAKISNTDASTWGKTLGECIGKDFAMKYLIK